MKTIRFALIVMILAVASTSLASPYFLIDGGTGGGAGAGSLGLGIGGTKAISNTHPLEVDFYFAFTNDVPGDLLDYPVPHSDYSVLGSKKNGNEYGFMLKAGYSITENFALMGGFGASAQENVIVARSNVTGWNYTQSSKTDMFADLYGGLLYNMGSVLFSAGYESRRGLVAGLAFSW